MVELKQFEFESEDEVIGPFRGKYSFLSNFYDQEIQFEGAVWPTSEHAYQAMKTLDLDAREKVRKASTPGKAKRAGRKVALRDDWEDVKIDVMMKVLEAKFSHPELQQKLLDTGDTPIVEINSWGDEFYGVCDGKGYNVLGQLLMELRSDLLEN